MNYYYSGKQTTTASYVIINFGFNAKNIIIQNANASSEDLVFSLDGTTVHGDIEPGEPLTLSDVSLKEIRVKSTSGGMTYRIWAWTA